MNKYLHKILPSKVYQIISTYNNNLAGFLSQEIKKNTAKFNYEMVKFLNFQVV